MSNPFPGDVEVTIGDARLVCRRYEITNKINDVSAATIRFNKHDFQQLGSVNYLDDVVIESVSTKKRVFAGNIVSVTSAPNDQVVYAAGRFNQSPQKAGG